MPPFYVLCVTFSTAGCKTFGVLISQTIPFICVSMFFPVLVCKLPWNGCNGVPLRIALLQVSHHSFTHVLVVFTTPQF